MQLVGVEASMADQFAAQQQDRDLMPITLARRPIAVYIDDFDRDAARFRHGPEFAEHFLAQAAARAGIQDQMGFRFGAPRGVQCCVDSPPLSALTDPVSRETPFTDSALTDSPMYSTVCAGTSPTTVTWCPSTSRVYK